MLTEDEKYLRVKGHLESMINDKELQPPDLIKLGISLISGSIKLANEEYRGEILDKTCDIIKMLVENPEKTEGDNFENGWF